MPEERGLAQAVINANKANMKPKFFRFPLYNASPHSMLMIFNSYKYVSPGERTLNALSFSGRDGILGPTLENKDMIQLPLPANIEDTYSIRVQGYDADFTGSLVAGAASRFAGAGDISVPNLFSTLTSALSGTGFSMDDLLSTNMSDISRNVAFLGRRAIDSVIPNAGRNIDVGLGNTVNPKASIYFDGVTLKQPSFTWLLAPSDRDESDAIRDISNFIKRHILPTYGSAVGFAKTLLNYPSTVDIFFLGIDQQYFVFYKTCMVQSFTLNFSPNGMAILKGGKPAMVTMQMSLIEMDIHTSEDYGGSSTFAPTVLETRIDER